MRRTQSICGDVPLGLDVEVDSSGTPRSSSPTGSVFMAVVPLFDRAAGSGKIVRSATPCTILRRSVVPSSAEGAPG
jgi:hypothetical protein